MMATKSIVSIASKESADIDAEIVLWWKNVQARLEGVSKWLPIEIKILFWDTVGFRHETSYQLAVFEDPGQQIVNASLVAPGVSITTRSTKIRAVWWLKLSSRFHRALNTSTVSVKRRIDAIREKRTQRPD